MKDKRGKKLDGTEAFAIGEMATCPQIAEVTLRAPTGENCGHGPPPGHRRCFVKARALRKLFRVWDGPFDQN